MPRNSWRKIVTDMAAMPGFGVNMVRRPSPADVSDWYEARAPAAWNFPAADRADETTHLRMTVHKLSPSIAVAATDRRREVMISNVKFVDLLDSAGLEILVCEMQRGGVWLGRPVVNHDGLQLLADVPHPAHAEVVDLDGDGRRDILVANLGSFLPVDHNLGTVEWLRQTATGVFKRQTLWSDLGRVADVQPADLDGDGDFDLVVGEFGWRATGHVLLLENATSDWLHPRFVRHDVDGRSGAIHVPAIDVDGDGRPDVLALLAQQHEQVAGYLNRGNWRYEAAVLYRAPHPSWGSSGMQPIDLDGDGDFDILLTNGDTLDDGRIKPYHGVQWLEQTGPLQFVPHHLAVFYGAHRAEAADLDGDGDLDIAACAFVDRSGLGKAAAPTGDDNSPGLIWLEQTAPGRFVRHNLLSEPAIYPTLQLGDYDGDGDPDLVTGLATRNQSAVSHWVEIRENRQD